MEEPRELSFDELHFESTAGDMAEEKAEFTLESGTYLATATKTDFSEVGGRQFCRMQCQLFRDDGSKARKVSVKMSHQKAYAYGKMDKAYRLFMRLVSATGADPTEPGEAYILATNSFFRLVVGETYLVDLADIHDIHADRTANDEGKVWGTLPAPNSDNKDEIERARYHYLGKGYEPIYLINNLLSE